MSIAELQTGLPAEGLVILGGRAVHVASQPGAGPPAVLLGGCAVPSYDWDFVADLLPIWRWYALTDPDAGFAVPDELPQLAAEVGTLEALLETTGPAILVAHSMAGFHAEALVRQRPDLVVGLVLADGSVELQPLRATVSPWLASGCPAGAETPWRFPALGLPASFLQRFLVAAQSHRRLTEPVSLLTRQTFRDPDAIAVCLPS
jgi:pimeloyl-ACP methyl ester carboxylesterase